MIQSEHRNAGWMDSIASSIGASYRQCFLEMLALWFCKLHLLQWLSCKNVDWKQQKLTTGASTVTDFSWKWKSGKNMGMCFVGFQLKDATPSGYSSHFHTLTHTVLNIHCLSWYVQCCFPKLSCHTLLLTVKQHIRLILQGNTVCIVSLFPLH